MSDKLTFSNHIDNIETGQYMCQLILKAFSTRAENYLICLFTIYVHLKLEYAS